MGAAQCCVTTCCAPAGADEDDPLGISFVDSMSVLDWGPANEPVGQVFEDTMIHLGTLDRQLLLFCSSSCLAAVRWLVHLGACLDACDHNGTTCLHVAVRAGALPVVSEMMRHALLLDAKDVASWTPLHIAAHMGRREVATRLLRAGASLDARNARGQVPSDLCMDPSTLDLLTGMVLISPDESAAAGSLARAVEEDSVGVPLRCEPECFFVNPAPILRPTAQHKKAMLHIAALIFNLRPSYGLAFAVVSGLVDSYTGAMRLFLQHGGACRAHLGSFLGEAFSLCTLLRFSVFDSLPLLHTGVSAALSRSFSILQLPEDLQKIDRLVRGLAHVWWRKHNAFADGLADAQPPQRQRQAQQQQQDTLSSPTGAEEPELGGLELKQYLASSDALWQLMLTTVLLHWYVHGNGSGPGRSLPFEAWLALNQGIELGGADVPDHLQRRIYRTICARFRPELALATPSGAAVQKEEEDAPDEAQAAEAQHQESNAGEAQVAEAAAAAAKATEPAASSASTAESIDGPVGRSLSRAASTGSDGGFSWTSMWGWLQGPPAALSVCATAEGWVQLLDGALPCPEGNTRQRTCEQPSSASSAAGLASVGLNGSLAVNSTGAGSAVFGEGLGLAQGAASGAVWASLCSIFLFIATTTGTDPASAPYALTDARCIRVAHVASDTKVLTLQGVPGPNANEAPLKFVVLLSDGRWQEVKLPKLSVKVGTAEELQYWVANLVQWSANQPMSV